jgi:hypothetical protein
VGPCASTAALDLQLSDTALRICGRQLAFLQPIASDAATAKLKKKKQTLTIVAPLLAQSEQQWQAAVTVRGLGRGKQLVRFTVDGGLAANAATVDEASDLCYALVSRLGHPPSRAAGDFDWCFAFGPTAVALDEVDTVITSRPLLIYMSVPIIIGTEKGTTNGLDRLHLGGSLCGDRSR